MWVSFVWGASLLHEPVNSWPVAVIALILLAVGIGGVAFTNAAGKELKRTERMDSSQDRQSKLPADDTEAQSAISETSSCVGSVQVDTRSDSDGVEGLDPVAESDVLDLEEKDAFNDDSEEVTIEEVDASAAVTPWHKVTKWLQSLSYQVVGIMCAAFIGFSNGTMMLPLSYAPPEAQGITYIVSFGIGALGITAGLLLVYFSFHFAIGRPLPSFHVKVAGKISVKERSIRFAVHTYPSSFCHAAAPALLTGVLWAAGNYCSIYATLYLGQTIGYPLVQCNLLVAGLWGIFYYHEIRGWFLVSCFLLWTTIVLVGVFMLSLAG